METKDPPPAMCLINQRVKKSSRLAINKQGLIDCPTLKDLFVLSEVHPTRTLTGRDSWTKTFFKNILVLEIYNSHFLGLLIHIYIYNLSLIHI